MAASRLSGQVASAAIWVLAARMVVRLSGLISIVILARLLPPADFGVVGLTVAFLAAFEAMSNMSLNAALVRHPEPERVHYDTVWTLGILRGLILGGATLLCAEPLAAFYGDERLVLIAQALAAQTVLYGFLNSGVADFQRDFTFQKDFAYTALRKLGGSLVCIALALTIWPDYRALVAGTMAGGIVAVASSFWLSAYRPRLGLGAFGELFGFSKWMVVTNLLQFLQARADTFIIGKVLGFTALGIYALALELADLVATEFAMPLQRAFMPGFAKLQDRLDQVRSSFGDAYGAAMAVAVPFGVGVAAVAEPAIRLAFGSAWMAAVVPLQILAFYGLARASATLCRTVIVALGAPRRLVPLQAMSLLVGLPAIWFGAVQGGLAGAAWAVTAMAVLYGILVMRDALRLMEADAVLVLRPMPRMLAAALAMVLAINAVASAMPAPETSGTAALVLLASVAVGAVVYPLALLSLWAVIGRPQGPETRLLGVAMPMLCRLRMKLSR